jgi:hypothetical protein
LTQGIEKKAYESNFWKEESTANEQGRTAVFICWLIRLYAFDRIKFLFSKFNFNLLLIIQDQQTG